MVVVTVVVTQTKAKDSELLVDEWEDVLVDELLDEEDEVDEDAEVDDDFELELLDECVFVGVEDVVEDVVVVVVDDELEPPPDDLLTK